MTSRDHDSRGQVGRKGDRDDLGAVHGRGAVGLQGRGHHAASEPSSPSGGGYGGYGGGDDVHGQGHEQGNEGQAADDGKDKRAEQDDGWERQRGSASMSGGGRSYGPQGGGLGNQGDGNEGRTDQVAAAGAASEANAGEASSGSEGAPSAAGSSSSKSK
jgi:hypothetical protein